MYTSRNQISQNQISQNQISQILIFSIRLAHYCCVLEKNRSLGEPAQPLTINSPPASRGESRGCGGARLTRRNGRPRERNPSLQRGGICVRNANNSIRKAPSKASSPLAHQFCVFLSSSSARCCPAVPEPLLEPSTWPGAVIIGVRALALAPYLEPRGVYFILVLSSRARRPRTTREVRASHPAPALACA